MCFSRKDIGICKVVYEGRMFFSIFFFHVIKIVLNRNYFVLRFMSLLPGSARVSMISGIVYDLQFVSVGVSAKLFSGIPLVLKHVPLR